MTDFEINLRSIYILLRIQVHPQVSIMKDHIVWNYFDINSLFALNSSSPLIFQVWSQCSKLIWNLFIFCYESKFTLNFSESRITLFRFILELIYILLLNLVHLQFSRMKDHIVRNYFDINSLFTLNLSSPPIFQNEGSHISKLFWNQFIFCY